MDKIAVDLTGVRVTALVELYARWLDARARHPILGDRWAEPVVQALDFDFSQFRSMSTAQFAVGVRSKVMDDWVTAYLARNTDAVVMDLGSGLDSRFFRVGPAEGQRWYDIDLPEVSEIAGRVYPEHKGRTTIGTSVTEPGWLAPIPADRPVAVVADGLFGFFGEEQVRRIFQEIVGHFPRGEIVFNTYSALVARRYAKRPPAPFARYGLTLDWTLEEPREVEAFDERLRFLEEASQVDSPLLARAPLYYKALCLLVRAVPSWRDAGRVLRYGF